MYTRCPECETVFRLSASALKKAGGRVRCGACDSTFNALQSLAEDFINPESARQFAEQAIDDGHISKEQGEALLNSLDKLEIPDVELEDTGVEWRVLKPPAELAEPIEDDLGVDTSGIIVSSDEARVIETDEDDTSDVAVGDDDDDEEEDSDGEEDEEEDLDDLDDEEDEEYEDDDLDDEDSDGEEFDEYEEDDEDLDDLDDEEDEDDEDFDEDEDEDEEDDEDLDDLDDEEEDLDEDDDLDDEDSDEEDEDEDLDDEDEEDDEDLDDLDDEDEDLDEDDDLDDDSDEEDGDEDLDDEDDEDFDDDEEDDEALDDEEEDLDEDDDPDDDSDEEDEDEDLDDEDDEDFDEDEEDDEDLDDDEEEKLDGLDDPDDEDDEDLEEESDDEEGDLDDGLDEEDEDSMQAEDAGLRLKDPESGKAADEPRYDDNSPLPEGADDLVEKPARKVVAKNQVPPVNVHEPLAEDDLDLGSAEEWEDLLGEVEDAIAEEAVTQQTADANGKEAAAEEPVEAQAADKRWSVEQTPAVESIVMEGDTLSISEDEASAEELERLAAQMSAGAAAKKPGRIGRTATRAVALLLTLVLVGQTVHSQRETLATLPYFPQTLGMVYRFFGYEVVPRWDVRRWQFEDTGGNTVTDDQVLKISSTLSNQATKAMPFPMIRVALTDLEDRVIETQLFGPRQYLDQARSLRDGVAAGQQFDASLEVPALRAEAAGFKLQICYPAANRQLRCAAGDFLR